METMNRDAMFVRSESVVARVIAGETLIVPTNAMVGDLAIAIVSEFEVEPPRAERDVMEFVGEMKAAGLVEVPAPVAMAAD